LIHHRPERDAVFFGQLGPKASVQIFDDPRQKLLGVVASSLGRLLQDGIELAAAAAKLDLSRCRLANAERLEIDLVLDFLGQLIPLHGEKPAKQPGKDMELFEANIGEGHDLRKKCIEPGKLNEFVSKICTLFF